MAVAVTDRPSKHRLRVTEIFLSIQGEAQFTGWPTVFVRLTGCPLRCQYCDTTYAFTGGEWWSIEDIVDEARGHQVGHVCVTGGEPLAQPLCLRLLTALCDAGFEVSVETSGALDIEPVDARVSRIMDLKTPGSTEQQRNRWENLEHLTLPRDSIKFVICDRADYEWCRRVLDERVRGRCPVYLSPSYGQLAPDRLAEWILEDHLPVRLQVQLHKVLWGEAPGR